MTAFESGEYVPPETAQELLRRYATGERRSHGVDLGDADLSGVTLDGADFDGSWFFDANFGGASLRGTSFRLCDVKCANFRRADLTSASFQLSGVEAAEFEEAVLVGASFEGASYYGYTIHGGDGSPSGGPDGWPLIASVMQGLTARQRIASKYHPLSGLRDERMSRQWAAAEAAAYGRGGVRAVSEAAGMSPQTIRKGSAELAERAANPDSPIPARIRRPGGGRRRCTESDPELTALLELLADPTTRGDPMSALRWACKSTTRLAVELTRQGHPVSPSTVGRLLEAAGYSLQSNRKTKEGSGHPDRDAQFEHIDATVKAFQERGQPVISVDTKEKE